MTVRRILAAAFFAALAIASIKPELMDLPFIDRRPLQRAMIIDPDGAWWPGYPAFLRDVAAATKPGDTIALVVPGMQWDNGYSYAYYRASYFLAGREVLPMITPEDRWIPANLARAKYVAAWRSGIDERWRVAKASHDGALLVRR